MRPDLLPIEIVGLYMRKAPVDLVGLAFALDLDLIVQPLSYNVSGKIRRAGDRFSVVVNSNHARRRRRFTIAHEIAHYILHKDLIEDEVIDDEHYRSRQLSPEIERQAGSYAAQILMPWRLVVEMHGAGLTSPTDLAEAFDVAPAVAELRLRELETLLAA